MGEEATAVESRTADLSLDSIAISGSYKPSSRMFAALSDADYNRSALRALVETFYMAVPLLGDVQIHRLADDLKRTFPDSGGIINGAEGAVYTAKYALGFVLLNYF